MRKLKARVRIGGEWIADPITHPAFLRQARLIASLYDAQIEHPALMTHRLPDGDRIGWSYAQPASAAEVRKRGAMMRAWAERSASSMIQTPDAVNLMIAAMVSAREFFRKAGEHFERNLVNYYSEARRRDWFIATVSGATEPLDSSPGVSPHRTHLRFTINPDGNVRVDGDAMVTLPGGLFDEVLLLPLWQDDEQTKIIVGAIPSNAPGSSFDCAITLPEAIDCRMHCENVIVPAERVFMRGDSAQCRWMMSETGAAIAILYQALVKAVARMRLEPSSGKSTSSIATSPQRLIAIDEMEEALAEAEDGAHQHRWGQFIPAQVSLELAAEAYRRINRAV